MKSNILVYKKNIFNLSETFIYKQVLALSKTNDVFVAGYKVNNNFPVDNFTVIQLRKTVFKKSYRILNRLASILVGKKKLSIAVFQLYQIIKEKRIQVVHAHYGTGGVKVLKAVKFTKTPLVVSFHGFDASSKLKNPAYSKQLPALLTYASAIIISSKHMIENLQLHKWIDKVHFIPYGIDADYFTPVHKSNNNIINLLHSGRIVEKKGVPDLIKVFYRLLQNHNNIDLHIVGAGEELEACKLLAEELAIPKDKIIFHGAQSQEGVRDFMSRSDIFILNSRTAADGNMEGLPNALLEAMSMGKAVVSTYHAGIPDAISNGFNGILVKEKDNDKLELAIETLINNPNLRAKLGEKAREKIKEQYTAVQMQEHILKVISQVITS